MPEIQSKQLRAAQNMPCELTALVSDEGTQSREGDVYLAPILAVCLVAVGFLGACGNKGDLYLPSDVVAVEELEEASEKLKKRKTTPSE